LNDLNEDVNIFKYLKASKSKKMPNLYHVASIGIRGISNCILNRALSVSFEVTRSCNASCKHCHLKGSILEEEQASAEDYAKRCCELKPYVVAMLSGGEPLLRKDLEKIIKALKEEGKAAYITVSTNGALLDKQRYDSLREAGIDLFSISFDYPDKLHDTFRGIPGLLSKILKLLKDIQHLEDNAITFCCVVQKDNYKDLPLIAEFARKWRVKLNLSTYTWLRTNRKEYMISN